jgi:hypothetical protein
VGKVLGIVMPAFSALRAGLAAVNVVQTPYNAVQAIINTLMAATRVGLVETVADLQGATPCRVVAPEIKRAGHKRARAGRGHRL